MCSMSEVPPKGEHASGILLYYYYYKHPDKIDIISKTLANFATYFISLDYEDYSLPILVKI